MPRRLVAVLLYALLLCMQQEGMRHQLEHLRGQLANAHEQKWQVAVNTPCDECALLAAAAHAVATAPASVEVLPATAWQHPIVTSGAAPAAPHHYSARAPPLLA